MYFMEYFHFWLCDIEKSADFSFFNFLILMVMLLKKSSDSAFLIKGLYFRKVRALWKKCILRKVLIFVHVTLKNVPILHFSPKNWSR